MPDERVEAAIKNWAPRFTSQGVDYNDFSAPPPASRRGTSGAASGLQLATCIPNSP